jgi:hypothetical protein
MSIDIAKATRSNRTYSRQLGWSSRFRQISQVLGFVASTPGEEQFALAVADWQPRHGLRMDGIVGPGTWARLRPLTTFSAAAAPLPGWLSAPSAQDSAASPRRQSAPGSAPVTGPSRLFGTRSSNSISRSRAYSNQPLIPPEELELHLAFMRIRSTVRAMGRLHASVEWACRQMYLIMDDPATLGEMQDHMEAVARAMLTQGEMAGEYGEAVSNHLVSSSRENRHSLGRDRPSRSIIPRLAVIADLRSDATFFGVDFDAEFNRAVEDQWQALQEVAWIEALVLIAMLLTDVGLTLAGQPVAAAAVTVGARAIARSLGTVSIRALSRCRFVVMQGRAIIRSLMGRLPTHGMEAIGRRLRWIPTRSYLLRVEATQATRPGGSFMARVFSNQAAAEAEARRLASSELMLRHEAALPESAWINEVGQISGRANRAGALRVYRARRGFPAIEGMTLGQREGGTVFLRPDHLRSLQHRIPELSAEWRGGGLELATPVGTEPGLVELVTSIAIRRQIY